MAAKVHMDKTKNQNMDAVATIVAAFAQRKDVSSEQIVDLTNRLMPIFTGTAARSTTAPRTVATEANEGGTKAAMHPAVPLDQAVTDDKVTCLCCGKGFTMLKRHLKAEHGLTEEEYRQAFALPDDFPLVAPNYSERKAAYAKQAGLGKYRRDADSKDALDAR